MEVVLGFAQVQGKGVVEEAEAGEGLLQAVDGSGGGLEVAVEIVGGGVVRGAFGQQSPFSELGSVSKYRRLFGRWAMLCGHDYRDGVAPHTDW